MRNYIDINDVECINSTNTKKDKFVGIELNVSANPYKIKVTFPLGYAYENNDFEKLKEQIIRLLRTIKLTKSINSYSRDLVKNEEHFIDNFPVDCYMDLINDFNTNGLYFEYENTYSKVGSKVNWKRTITNSKPLYSNGNIIYSDLIFNSKNSIYNLLTEIEKYCLNLASERIGWLLNFRYAEDSYFEDDDIEEMIYLLDDYYNSCFKDRDKLLISAMKGILSGFNNEYGYDKSYSYGTENYNVVYECILRELFNNVDLNKYYPRGLWHFDGSQEDALDIVDDELIEQSSVLRPDLIYKEKVSGKDVFYIMDAKYYGYIYRNGKKSDGLPTTSDIQKQITYAEYVEIIDRPYMNNIYNAFILPFDKTNNKMYHSENIVPYGYATANWYSTICNYQKVVLLFIDTKYLIDLWYENSSKNISAALINIKECIKETVK